MAANQTPRLPLLWIAGLTTAALLLSLLTLLSYPALRARYLFHQLEDLQLGKATFDDAQRFARKLGANPVASCDRYFCNWEVHVNNAHIPQWWRGAGETFLVSFDVKDSLVVRRNTGYGIGLWKDHFSPSSVGLVEQANWGRVPIQQPVSAGWQTTEFYRYYAFTVYMTPKASPQDRQRYTAYDYGCFWRYKGCADARQLLPSADPMPTD